MAKLEQLLKMIGEKSDKDLPEIPKLSISFKEITEANTDLEPFRKGEIEDKRKLFKIPKNQRIGGRGREINWKFQELYDRLSNFGDSAIPVANIDPYKFLRGVVLQEVGGDRMGELATTAPLYQILQQAQMVANKAFHTKWEPGGLTKSIEKEIRALVYQYTQDLLSGDKTVGSEFPWKRVFEIVRNASYDKNTGGEVNPDNPQHSTDILAKKYPSARATTSMRTEGATLAEMMGLIAVEYLQRHYANTAMLKNNTSDEYLNRLRNMTGIGQIDKVSTLAQDDKGGHEGFLTPDQAPESINQRDISSSDQFNAG